MKCKVKAFSYTIVVVVTTYRFVNGGDIDGGSRHGCNWFYRGVKEKKDGCFAVPKNGNKRFGVFVCDTKESMLFYPAATLLELLERQCDVGDVGCSSSVMMVCSIHCYSSDRRSNS